MRADERDSRPFPLPIYQMDGIPIRDALMHRCSQKKCVVVGSVAAKILKASLVELVTYISLVENRV